MTGGSTQKIAWGGWGEAATLELTCNHHRGPRGEQRRTEVGASVPMQVIAFSTPLEDPLWRWRILNYEGETIEESRTTFPTIASAVEEGSKRLRQMDAVDESVPLQAQRSTRHLRVP